MLLFTTWSCLFCLLDTDTSITMNCNNEVSGNDMVSYIVSTMVLMKCNKRFQCAWLDVATLHYTFDLTKAYSAH